jgi:hypothetical protein
MFFDIASDALGDWDRRWRNEERWWDAVGFEAQVQRETRSFSGGGGRGRRRRSDLEGFLAADSKNKSWMDAKESQTWSMFDVVGMDEVR